MKNKSVFVAALVFGVLAMVGVYWYIEQMEQKLDQTEYVQVLVPREDIKVNVKVSANMFKQVQLPREYIHPQAITQPEEIEGAITKSMLVAEEQLLRDKLVQRQQYGDGLAYQIQPGYRAVSIPINQVSGVAGLIKPGDRVDVVATLDVPDQDANEDDESIIISTYVLQDILILATDTKTERQTEGGGDMLERQTLTLELLPSDAPNLVLASERGNLRLLLRSPVDQGRTDAPPAKLSDFNY